jgi:hypothetical protein
MRAGVNLGIHARVVNTLAGKSKKLELVEEVGISIIIRRL